MKKQYLRMLMALVGFAGFAITAHGQAVNRIVVTIPFDFVVSGKTLPAGSYKISPASIGPESRTLVVSSYRTGASVLVVPFKVENARGDKPQLSFQRVGHQYVLSGIQTTGGVYATPIPVRSSPEILVASRNPSASGIPGSN